MPVEDRLTKIYDLSLQIRRYNNLVKSNSFTDETLTELKTNAKAICDEIKDEMVLVKTDIDAWGE